MLDTLPTGVKLKDQGLHRLKDLLRPERIWVVETDGTRLQTLLPDSLNKVQHNLPIQLTSFVGRQEDLERVEGLISAALQDGTKRLVTLVGSGGCGKTRLALQCTSESADEFHDGVWFVDLALLPIGSECDQAVIKALRLSEQGSSQRQTILNALGGRQALLILDNCEHVIESAADLVGDLLAQCPDLVILATSREALRLPGEIRWRVPSLSVPAQGESLDEISGADSVRLFCERAALISGFRLTSSNAESVAALCRLLDGIPLAVEQAASHSGSLSPQQMLSRFQSRVSSLYSADRGALPRHQTLRATIAWSYDLLMEPEKLLLQRCALFVGGWTLELAEAVCSDESLTSEEIGSGMQALLGKSMVFVEEGLDQEARYRMLQTIAEFAGSMGEPSAEAKERHISTLCRLATEHAFVGDIDWCEAEFTNLSVALEHLAKSDPIRALATLNSLRAFLMRFSHFRFARRLFEMTLPAAEDEGAKALGMNALGAICYRLGDFAAAREKFEASLAYWLAVGDSRSHAAALINLGLVSAMSSDLEDAKLKLESAIEITGALDDPARHGQALLNLGRVLLDLGHLAEALARFEECLPLLAEQSGITATAHANMSLIFYQEGDNGLALKSLAKALAFLASSQNESTLALCFLLNACIAKRLGAVDERHESYRLFLFVARDTGLTFNKTDERLIAEASEGLDSELGSVPTASVECGLAICKRLTTSANRCSVVG
jgi:predicted ATPase